MTASSIPEELAKNEVIHHYFGFLLARCGEAYLSYPGEIGMRPIDMHLKPLCRWEQDRWHKRRYAALQGGKLTGCEILPDYPSVARRNIMLAASLAQVRSLSKNAAKEPEIDDYRLLRKMGIKLRCGTGVIRIQGPGR